MLTTPNHLQYTWSSPTWVHQLETSSWSLEVLWTFATPQRWTHSWKEASDLTIFFKAQTWLTPLQDNLQWLVCWAVPLSADTLLPQLPIPQWCDDPVGTLYPTQETQELQTQHVKRTTKLKTCFKHNCQDNSSPYANSSKPVCLHPWQNYIWGSNTGGCSLY